MKETAAGTTPRTHLREGTAARLGQVSRHTAAVLLANIIALGLGLAITVVAARLFGTGPQVDAFFVALLIPQVVSQVLLSVALLVIVPAYAERSSSRGAQHALDWMAPLLGASALMLSLGCAALCLAAPWLVGLVAPGFDAHAAAEGSRLLVWLSPSIVLLGLSGILQGVANASGCFFRSAWARTLPAAAGLVLVYLLHERFGFVAFAWGMCAGALVGLVWQWHEVSSFGKVRLRLSGLGQAFADIRESLGVIAVARALVVSGGLVSAAVASTVAVGAVAVLGYAFRIASIPFLLSASVGVVVFPALALARVEERTSVEDRLLDGSIRFMGVFGLACALPLFVYALPLVAVLFERGEFSAADARRTAAALQVFAVAIPLSVVNTQIGNAYWARGLRVPRMVVELCGVAALLAGSVVLGRHFAVAGLAAAVVLQYAVQVGLCVWPVPNLTQDAPSTIALRALRTPLVIALGVGVLLYALQPDGAWSTWPWLARALAVAAAICGSVFLFLGVCFAAAVPEVDRLLAQVLARVPRWGSHLDPHQVDLLAQRARRRLRREVSRLWPFHARRRTAPEDLLSRVAAGTTAAQVARTFRTTPPAFGCYAGGPAVRFIREALAAEAKAQNREVDLLGSGPLSLGKPIAWHKDYVSGFTWPLQRSERLVLVDLGSDADCKFPWELARCQHWPHLAAGADRSRCAQEMWSQFEEFAAANPPGFGIAYGNAMEVALRAVNWIVAFRALSAEFSLEQLQHVAVEMDHAGRFIHAHLETVARGLNTNHYIADLLGLYVISTYFPSLKDAREWHRLSGDELAAELPFQFDADGVHREGAPAYARLVLEFYLAAFLLGRACHDPRVLSWAPALERAIGALCDQSVGGALPRLGDDDSGRLLVPPGEPPQDYRYLFQIGVVLFDRCDWKAHAGEPRPGLEFWLGTTAVERYEALGVEEPSLGMRLFPRAGLAIVRSASTWLALQGGRREAKSPRAHLHNDLTSMEYVADGEHWLLDPGTYEYSRRAVWRNRFRSTGVHNVVQVDGSEQNRFRPDWLFYLGRDAEPLGLTVNLEAVTAGYALPPGSPCDRVWRTVQIRQGGRVVDVCDRVEGSGRHQLTLGWNLSRRPFSFVERDLLAFKAETGSLLLHVPTSGGLYLAVADSWYSPRFGVRERCFRVETRGHVTLPWELTWCMAAVPCGEPLNPWIQKLRRTQPESPRSGAWV